MFLEQVIKYKRSELELARRQMPLSQLIETIKKQAPPCDFASALKGDEAKIIAEVKKASPAKGVFSPHLDHIKLACTYAQNGAAAISVLTEERFFQGSLLYLSQIKGELTRQGMCLPLLRKDFILEPYQVYESRAYGADAILLIVAILDDRLKELLELSRSLGMDCLVEVHTAEEVKRAIEAGAHIIGINNRDLSTFEVDIEVTKRLIPFIPQGLIVVSESGIRGRGDICRLRQWGVDGVLIGEALVKARDVADRLRSLRGDKG